MLSVQTIGGQQASIAINQVTHIIDAGHGTCVFFSSGEQIIVTDKFEDLALKLGRALN